MATTNGNRKLLDLKRWEQVTPAPTSAQAGSFIASSRHFRQQQLFSRSLTETFLYNPTEDGWITIPNPGLAGTLSAGAAGVASAFGAGAAVASSLTATGGTTSTIITNQTLARSIAGYSVHILSGPNAGVTLPILSNTIGATATITVATQASAFTASTVYRLCTPVWYVVGSGTIASGSFKKYDFATNTWVTLQHTGLPGSIATDGKLISTPSWLNTDYKAFATGTATAGGASTLTNSAKTWATNQWTNYQIRIVSGTGAGQIRTIASNTGTVITVGSAWTTQPDATSVYSIEGNDDFIYYMGNNAVTMYRYSISANTWTTLSPVAARAAAPGVGMSGHWIHSESNAAWTNESEIINGKRIYSFRGAGSAILDYYDIAANTWVSALTYSPAVETFTTGTKYVYLNDKIYIQKEATNRWFEFDIAEQNMIGWTTMPVVQGAGVVGDTAFDATYYDGATEINYVYMLLNTSSFMFRQMII
jgi:hypothetical protein